MAGIEGSVARSLTVASSTGRRPRVHPDQFATRRSATDGRRVRPITSRTTEQAEPCCAAGRQVHVDALLPPQRGIMSATGTALSAISADRDGPLFQEGRIGRMTLRNRFVQAPIFTQFATTWGEVDDRLIEYHRARARGGIGLIILENTSRGLGSRKNRRTPHPHRPRPLHLGAGGSGRSRAQRGCEDRGPAPPHRPAEHTRQHHAQRAADRPDRGHHERVRDRAPGRSTSTRSRA